ncbi:MAG: activator of ATPase 1 family protein [Subtercola sp.]|jgi:uncharacterized protein YndB with AHSA1/START domain|nr:activator of ATPase 1 family protein [Subtercola sp.]
MTDADSIQSTVDKNALALTFVAEFDATPERVWQVWQDPRQLERWWGPPTWPATFTRHEPVVGGESRYYMTGPEGEKSGGWWRITAVDEPRLLEFDDGFADEAGQPNDSMPTIRMRVTLEPLAGNRTRMTTVGRFASEEHMEQMLTMGMHEGTTLAMGQIYALLSGASTTSGAPTTGGAATKGDLHVGSH